MVTSSIIYQFRINLIRFGLRIGYLINFLLCIIVVFIYLEKNAITSSLYNFLFHIINNKCSIKFLLLVIWNLIYEISILVVSKCKCQYYHRNY